MPTSAASSLLLQSSTGFCNGAKFLRDIQLSAVLVHTYHEVFPMLAADLLERRKMQFTLWRPNGNQNAPKLVIGTFQAGNPNVVANRLELPLATSAATAGTLESRSP
jgi:hypothetical protein